ncbi:MAG: hypothetical protein AB7P21_10300 [Lautropia sp.]
MSRYAFADAGPSDDAGLRHRLASDVLPGAISLTFRREPSYFDAAHLQGLETEVIKCTDLATGEIVGMASRSLRLARVDGAAARVAYLADLRGDRRHRNGTLLARGFRELARRHRARPAALTYAVIYEGNEAARRLLVSGRAGLPAFTPFDRLLTPAIHLDLPRPAIGLPGVVLRRAREPDRDGIVALLAREWQRKHLAPADPAQALAGGELRSIAIADFFVAMRGDEAIGCLAAWDQSRLRQTHVEAYGGALRVLRPAYNVLAAVSPLKPLPAPSQPIPSIYFGAIATEGNDPAVLRALLRCAYNATRKGHWHYAIAGLCESDPLSQVLRDYRRIEAAGMIHLVRFAGDPPPTLARCAAGRPTYLEAGCL